MAKFHPLVLEQHVDLIIRSLVVQLPALFGEKEYICLCLGYLGLHFSHILAKYSEQFLSDWIQIAPSALRMFAPETLDCVRGICKMIENYPDIAVRQPTLCEVIVELGGVAQIIGSALRELIHHLGRDWPPYWDQLMPEVHLILAHQLNIDRSSSF
jgi:hypothetical protein